jgi:hypothetical protein
LFVQLFLEPAAQRPRVISQARYDAFKSAVAKWFQKNSAAVDVRLNDLLPAINQESRGGAGSLILVIQ